MRNPSSVPCNENLPGTAAHLAVFDIATFRFRIDDQLDEFKAPWALDFYYILHHSHVTPDQGRQLSAPGETQGGIVQSGSTNNY